MLSGVISSGGVLEATENNGVAISAPVLVTSKLIITSETDGFYSNEINDGDRLSVRVDGILVRFVATVTGGRIDTSSATQGATPEDVFFTSDLRQEVSNTKASFELVNISEGSIENILITTHVIENGDSVLCVKSDGSVIRAFLYNISNSNGVYQCNIFDAMKGDVPDAVFTDMEGISLNDTALQAYEEERAVQYLGGGEVSGLNIVKKYADTHLVADKIEAIIQLSAIGDKMTALEYKTKNIVRDS